MLTTGQRDRFSMRQLEPLRLTLLLNFCECLHSMTQNTQRTYATNSHKTASPTEPLKNSLLPPVDYRNGHSEQVVPMPTMRQVDNPVNQAATNSANNSVLVTASAFYRFLVEVIKQPSSYKFNHSLYPYRLCILPIPC